MKLADVGEVGEQSVSGAAQSVRHRWRHLVGVQPLLVTLATTYHVTSDVRCHVTLQSQRSRTMSSSSQSHSAFVGYDSNWREGRC